MHYDDHTDVSRCAAKCSLKVRKIGSTKRLPCSLLVEYDIMSNISMLNPLGVTLHLMQNIFKKWFSRINQAIMDNKNHFFFPYAVCVRVCVCVCVCCSMCSVTSASRCGSTGRRAARCAALWSQRRCTSGGTARPPLTCKSIESSPRAETLAF